MIPSGIAEVQDARVTLDQILFFQFGFSGATSYPQYKGVSF